MKKVKAVIGLGWGDEGKGMWTDFLAKTSPNSVIVRNCGGAQSDHRVMVDDRCQTFSQSGSSCWRRIPTICTENVTVNPVLFSNEIDETGITPNVFINHFTRITTIYDMLANQIIDNRNWKFRHGSSGTGYGQTLIRENSHINFVYGDILFYDHFDKIKKIRDYWLRVIGNIRKEETESKSFVSVYNFFENENCFEHFAEKCEDLVMKTHLMTNYTLNEFDSFIFENCLRLMLDRDSSNFPYVSHAETGISGVIKFLEDHNVGSRTIESFYMTRCYQTKTGNGRFPNETQSIDGVSPKYSSHRHYCGETRIAPLNLWQIDHLMKNEDRVSFGKNVISKKVVTCVDHLNDNDVFYIDQFDRKRLSDKAEFLRMLNSTFDHVVQETGYL